MYIIRLNIRFISLLLPACLFTFLSFSQPVWTFDPFGKASTDTKSEEYKERLLPSERTADKKFTFWRRFTHNNATHYNYFFNANNKLNLVLETAKESQQDDYSKLLSFYPYTLDNTASQATELDSVIYKSTAGILTHDLRTDWVDNLYLLIGQAYYFKKEFDSAALTFQFINYNLFPRKKKEEENRIIGENDRAKSNSLSIADHEKRNLIQKILTLPPSRNDALIWLAQTFIELDKYGESAGLITILQNDPNLPKRLKPKLDEVNAYWFFKQEQYDSAAVYLEKSIKSIKNKSDKSRQLFLLAQLYEMTRQFDKASACYLKSAGKTASPLMDISAHLNNAKMMRNNGNIKELEKSVSALEKMAKKDKYEAYRDIIYYSAGMLSVQKPDTAKAIDFFQKSLKKNENNEPYRNKAHLMLGKIAYIQRNYKEAADHYDSIDVMQLDPVLEDTADATAKKNALRRVADFLSDIQNADSLLMLASLSPEQLDAVVKREVKKAKKAASKDQKEVEEENNLSMLSTDLGKNSAQVDLFASSNKGEWYFYNNSMKSKGFNEFQSKWGKRPNTDNWRRKSAINAASAAITGMNGLDDPLNVTQADSDGEQSKSTDNSYEAFIANVPTTEDQKASIHQRVTDDLVGLAQIFEMELLDYRQALGTFEIYLQRYPDSLRGGEIFLSMYHCYQKLNDQVNAKYYKHLLDSLFSESRYVKMINDPASLQPEKNNPDFESKYTQVFSLMQVENYDSALALKDKIDCDYGDHYWTPQLLYMWAICAIKCTSDSQAIYLLQSLLHNYPGTVLAEKATSLIDVLQRRTEIEGYLSGTQIERASEDPTLQMPVIETPVKKNNVIENKPISKQPEENKLVSQDSGDGTFGWKLDDPHVVLMLLDQVDPVYVNETVKAINRYNAQKSKQGMIFAKKGLTPKYMSLQYAGFTNQTSAFEYCKELKKMAPSDLSFLSPGKFRFIITSEHNLQVLSEKQNVEDYLKFLHDKMPDSF